MENDSDIIKNAELLNRLTVKEEPEQISDWDTFKKDWLTLREASELINRSDRYVRNIIDIEKMSSRTFIGGNFGKKPTRCVNKAQIISWFQGNMNKKPEQVNIQAQSQDSAQYHSPQTSSSTTDLNSSLKSVSDQISDIKDQIARMTPQPENPKAKTWQTAFTILIILAALIVLAYFGSMILTMLLDIKK